jgi:hypothetical protein
MPPPIVFVGRTNAAHVHRERRVPGAEIARIRNAPNLGRQRRVHVAADRDHAREPELRGLGREAPAVVPAVVVDFDEIARRGPEVPRGPLVEPDGLVRCDGRQRRVCIDALHGRERALAEVGRGDYRVGDLAAVCADGVRQVAEHARRGEAGTCGCIEGRAGNRFAEQKPLALDYRAAARRQGADRDAQVLQ